MGYICEATVSPVPYEVMVDPSVHSPTRSPYRVPCGVHSRPPVCTAHLLHVCSRAVPYGPGGAVCGFTVYLCRAERTVEPLGLLDVFSLNRLSSISCAGWRADRTREIRLDGVKPTEHRLNDVVLFVADLFDLLVFNLRFGLVRVSSPVCGPLRSHVIGFNCLMC